MQAYSVQRPSPPTRPGGAKALTPVQELNDVLGGLSGPISARLAAELATKVRLPEKQLREMFEIAVPGVLQAEFESNLLAKGPEVRAARAKLAHALSCVELAEAVPAAGNATVIGGDDGDLTSEAAARVLHVSRSHVNSLADSGALGRVTRTAGGHRRISRAAVLAYKEQSRRTQSKGLAAMMAATDEAGLYDLELASPRKRKPR